MPCGNIMRMPAWHFGRTNEIGIFIHLQMQIIHESRPRILVKDRRFGRDVIPIAITYLHLATCNAAVSILYVRCSKDRLSVAKVFRFSCHPSSGQEGAQTGSLELVRLDENRNRDRYIATCEQYFY